MKDTAICTVCGKSSPNINRYRSKGDPNINILEDLDKEEIFGISIIGLDRGTFCTADAINYFKDLR